MPISAAATLTSFDPMNRVTISLASVWVAVTAESRSVLETTVRDCAASGELRTKAVKSARNGFDM